MKYGFFRFFHSASAAAPFGSFFAADRGKSTEIKFPPTCSLSRFHAALEGHAGSDGRRRVKVVLARRGRGKTDSSAADPIALTSSLLFIMPAARPVRDHVLAEPCGSVRIAQSPSRYSGRRRPQGGTPALSLRRRPVQAVGLQLSQLVECGGNVLGRDVFRDDPDGVGDQGVHKALVDRFVNYRSLPKAGLYVLCSDRVGHR